MDHSAFVDVIHAFLSLICYRFLFSSFPRSIYTDFAHVTRGSTSAMASGGFVWHPVELLMSMGLSSHLGLPTHMYYERCSFVIYLHLLRCCSTYILVYRFCFSQLFFFLELYIQKIYILCFI